MTRSRLVVLLAVGGLLAVTTSAAFAPAVTAAGPDDISIVDTSFQPTDLTVNVGDTVTWTITKAIADPHSVTSGTLGDSSSGKLFDSGIVLRNNGDHYQFTFTTPGTVPFYCQVHPTTMKGTITVLAAGQSAPPPAPSAAASQGPAASAAPGASGAPSGSGAPSPSAAAEPPGADLQPVPAADKAIAAGVLVVALLLLFGSAVLYRRMNRG